MATNSFQEFDHFNSRASVAQAAPVFKNWNPFAADGPSEEELKRQATVQREEELVRREATVKQKEVELAQREAELNNMALIVKTISAGFEEAKKNHWEHNVREMIDFGLGLAEKIVMDKIAIDPTVLARQVKEAVDSVKVDEPIEIHMSAQELEALQSIQSELVTSLFANKNLKWIADLKLNLGEIFIDTQNYRLDSSVLTVIRNVKADYEEIKNQPQLVEDVASAEITNDEKPESGES